MEKNCRKCSNVFEVPEEDLAFYERVAPEVNGKKIPIPAPSHCPRCRQQRRLAWRNEQNLYQRRCSLCERQIVSVFSPQAVFPVYCVDCWWSDRWNPLAFGIRYDPAQPFLAQLQRLQSSVPQLAIQNDNGIGSENSEYCYDISRAKNCYRVVGSWYMENCLYSLNVNRCKFLVDCNTVSIDSELVYECLDSQRLYHCAYLQNCDGCSDCFFGYDLKGCRNCVACYGLRQQQFRIFNEQFSEAEYHSKLSTLQLGSHEARDRFRSQFDEWILSLPKRAANIQNSEDCIGNNLFNCKSVLGYSVYNSEYSKYLDRCDGPRNCHDMINTGGPQWCYDCVTPDDSYLVLFSAWCWKSRNIIYSDNCHSSENLCGCISLRRHRFCILNQEYDPDDYEEKVMQIVESLKREGAWGGMLPISLSPFAYNEAAAHEYYPLSREAVEEQGWRWSENLPNTTGKETISWANVADDIQFVRDDIVDHVLACVDCRKNYKITPQELKFYRLMPAAVPRRCPQCRHAARFRKKTPTEIWDRSCAKCEMPLKTSFPPDGRDIIYCDSCYFAQVY